MKIARIIWVINWSTLYNKLFVDGPGLSESWQGIRRQSRKRISETILIQSSSSRFKWQRNSLFSCKKKHMSWKRIVLLGDHTGYEFWYDWHFFWTTQFIVHFKEANGEEILDYNKWDIGMESRIFHLTPASQLRRDIVSFREIYRD